MQSTISSTSYKRTQAVVVLAHLDEFLAVRAAPCGQVDDNERVVAHEFYDRPDADFTERCRKTADGHGAPCSERVDDASGLAHQASGASLARSSITVASATTAASMSC